MKIKNKNNSLILWEIGRLMIIVVAALWCVFLVAPIFVIIVSSFTSGDYLAFPPPGWSFKWFVSVANLSWFRSSFITSILISTSSTGIAILVGVMVARALARYRPRGYVAIEFIALSPLILPAVVLGFALFKMINMLELESYAIPNLIAGHVLVTVPFIVRSVWSAMAGTDVSYEEVAQSMGATPLVVFRKVILPMARPGILAGGVLAFTYSFNDVSISVFLASSQAKPLAVELMSNMEYSADPTPAAVSTIMVAIAIGFFVLVERIGGMKMFIGK